MRRARLDVRVPTAQKERWQKTCAETGLDLSEAVRRGTDLYLELWPVARARNMSVERMLGDRTSRAEDL